MEKQANRPKPMGKKRRRKISSSDASDHKYIKIESPTKLKTNPKLSLKKEILESPTIQKNVTEATKTAKTKSIKVEGKKNANDILEEKPLNIINPKTNSDKLNIDNDDNKIASPKKKKKGKPIPEQNTTIIKTLENFKPLNMKENTLEEANAESKKLSIKKEVKEPTTLQNIEEKYPVLKDKALIERFMSVKLNNNQKGRIRLAIKSSLLSSSNTMFPEIINGKIQAILQSSQDLTDSALRRIRILYNMLKTSLENPSELIQEEKINKKQSKEKKNKVRDGDEGEKELKKKEKPAQKVKGPKRYVVFLGNLPLTINKDQIMEHFRELNKQIKDVRVPKVAEGKKSAIAYLELTNEPSYELALSKHHSMLGNKRINVLYSTQQKSKISKSEAKSKSAKLIAMQKAGKLIGSTPQGKKRSHRRAIMKKARAKDAAVSA